MAKGNDVLEVADVDELIDRGLLADEEQDADLAERILDEAGDRLGENHPRVLHLAGRLAWASGDIERATGFFQQAADQTPTRADIYIDCARCLHLLGEDDSAAEAQLRAALELPNIDALHKGDALVLLSQIRLEDDDAEEALELLEQIPASLKTQALYFSAKADVLVDLERIKEALECLDAAVTAEPKDPDYHYQQGLARQSIGDIEGGIASMLKVLEIETELRGPSEAPSAKEVQTLRSVLEEVMEELPSPLLELVANAPVRVQAGASPEQVREGADPRTAVFFEGTPKLEEGEAELTGIVVARDVLLDEIEDDEEIGEALLLAMASEIADFFAKEDLIYAEASS
ncbi:MAG: tetratricopeptide repeat protein [Myxococcota bacterium]